MDRKEFIKTCASSCLAFAGISFLESCAGTHYVQAAVSESGLSFSKGEFTELKKGKKHMRNYVVVKSEKLNFPIIVRFVQPNNYEAYLMRCSHQSAELSVNGDILTCPAHGSEFDKKGEVIQGPAEQKLKSFPVKEEGETIHVLLT